MDWVLRDDALSSEPGGPTTLRIGLPWIRSLPVSCVIDLEVRIEGQLVAGDDTGVVLGREVLPLSGLRTRPEWWFLQDRLPVTLHLAVGEAEHHDVAVLLRLLLPYLDDLDGHPAVLPFQVSGRLRAGTRTSPGVSHDVSQYARAGRRARSGLYGR